MRKINRIVVHCSASSIQLKAKDIVNYHLRPKSRGGRGWRNPGYHFIVEADGTVVNTLNVSKISNGAKGYNADSVHVCYVGGIDSTNSPADTRTPTQKESLRRLLIELREKLGPIPIVGHRDLSPDSNGNGKIEPFEWIKACPCFDARKEYAELK